MEYPSLPVTNSQADLSDMFVLTSLILAHLPRLFAWMVGRVLPAAPVRWVKDTSVRTAQAQKYPLAPIHAPPPRLIV
jgi:hypothetical protein